MLKTNYHTHSKFSDGKNSVEEMCISAIEKNVSILGFSDHSYVEFDLHSCMKKDFSGYVSEINNMRGKYSNKLEIVSGVELDAFSENIYSGFVDYIIASAHYVKKDDVIYTVDYSREVTKDNIEKGFASSTDAYAIEYFDTLCRNIESNKPDIVGHFDLVAMFGNVDETTTKYKNAALSAAEFAMQCGCVIELNTAAVFKKLKNIPYPSEYILKYVLEHNGRVTINSDAHVSQNIDFYFNETVEFLKQFGFKTIAYFTNGHFEEQEII